MKTLLAKFFKSLACRVAIALITTATVAKAHDLPQHFPLAPTDWGMIQQDCMGHGDSRDFIGSTSAADSNIELSVAMPDAGSPPRPERLNAEPQNADEAATALIGPQLYDGVDCAQLESMYRSQASADLVEYRPAAAATLVAGGAISNASSNASSLANASVVVADDWQFHKSHFAACSCDFENGQATQLVVAPKFTFERICIADFFASLAYRKPALVLRDWQANHTKQIVAPNFVTPLAAAVPAAQLQNRARLADAFSEFATWDCIVRGELYHFQGASRAGELAAKVAKSWIGSTVPTISREVAKVANRWQPAAPQLDNPQLANLQLDKRELAQRLVSSAPMFIIYQTDAGNEVAVPIAQARNFTASQPTGNSLASVATNRVSPEFQQMVNTANARLKWAGGRLSEAASAMNDWFTQRIARTQSNELR